MLVESTKIRIGIDALMGVPNSIVDPSHTKTVELHHTREAFARAMQNPEWDYAFASLLTKMTGGEKKA